MRSEKQKITDDVSATMSRVRQAESKNFIRANVHTRLIGPDGEIKHESVGENLVTDAGDEHIVRRVVEGATEGAILGMKLGTNATAAAKNTAGHHIGAYITGSYEALDATPTLTDKGAGAGYRGTHICTWIAGDITNATINEVILTQDGTDAAGVAADTVARYVFPSTIDKQAGDSLEVTWHIDVLGA